MEGVEVGGRERSDLRIVGPEKRQGECVNYKLRSPGNVDKKEDGPNEEEGDLNMSN